VTDADVVLGYLHPEHLLGGALPIHAERARAAIETHVARPLALDVVQAAAGMLEVVTASMAAALRIVSVERGYDPREFTLVAFGGAGPVHAARLAEDLEIREVLVPPIPGGFSALGLVGTDLRRDQARTVYARLDTVSPGALAAHWAAMEAEAQAMLARAEVPPERRDLLRSADCRYPRQAYELTVPVAPGPVTAETLARLATDFHERHRATYGHANPGEPVQLVNLRLAAVGRLPRLDLARAALDGAPVTKAGRRPVFFRETGLIACDVVPRQALSRGSERPGPLIVESMDTTVVVPPGWRLRVDEQGFLVLEVRAHA